MNIFITDTLTSNQYHDAVQLIEACNIHDMVPGISFLKSEMNYIEGFPCFYMLYDGSELVSFLSVFIPDESQCEIYAHTLPSHRQKGYFLRLFEAAVENIYASNIDAIYILNEPSCVSGSCAISKLNADFSDSEHLMYFDRKHILSPTLHRLSLEIDTKYSTDFFYTYLDDTLVGKCKADRSRTNALIYDFEVLEDYRGKGYGSETLILVLNHLLKEKCENIRLQVSGSNTAAKVMYSHHGFKTAQQIDYYKLSFLS